MLGWPQLVRGLKRWARSPLRRDNSPRWAGCSEPGGVDTKWPDSMRTLSPDPRHHLELWTESKRGSTLLS